jgi:hypothetical protein
MEIFWPGPTEQQNKDRMTTLGSFTYGKLLVIWYPNIWNSHAARKNYIKKNTISRK